MNENEFILKPGRNCLRKVKATRGAFLIDGQAYFSAFVDSVERARSSVFIMGWDIDSRTMLKRGPDGAGADYRLGEFLDRCVKKRKSLNVFVLAWEFAMIYTFEREFLPLFKLGWKTHSRIHFEMDGNHPTGASHHRKIVVVDERVAFVGGLDLTQRRWDSSDHRPDESRRTDPGGELYAPFHDVQFMVEGEAAEALGKLFRERWERTVGFAPVTASGFSSDPWPPEIKPDLLGVDVAISRTQPEYGDEPEVREVERLYVDAIASARETIYIENQYFTAGKVAEALEARLRDPHGPEVVLIMPYRNSGWLEEAAMGSVRAVLLKRLKEADRHGRMQVYYPFVPGLGDRHENVHAKVLVVDDRLVRVGSSNLSNRSMGLDTECDLAVEAQERKDISEAIAGFRNRLLSEHLQVDRETLEGKLAGEGSLIAAIEKLSGEGATLRKLETEVPEWVDDMEMGPRLLDPERPVALERMIEEFVSESESEAGWLRPGPLITAGVFLVAAGVCWRFTSLPQWLNSETASQWVFWLRSGFAFSYALPAAYVASALLFLPVSLPILATLMIFGTVKGIFYAFFGIMTSAAFLYFVGALLGRDRVKRAAGPWLNRISKRLSRGGLAAAVAVRIVPVAPFSMVSTVAGASRVRLKDYLVGTLLGATPGILSVALLANRFLAVLENPNWSNLLTFAGGVCLVGYGYARITGRFGKAGKKRT